jgi:hypothetical protein
LLLHSAAAIAAEPWPCPAGDPCEASATEAAAPHSAEANVSPKAPHAPAEVAILAHLGIATPVGGIGISLDAMPVSLLAIHVGVGTNGEGPEFEAGARLRLHLFHDGYVTLGSGWSVAHYTGHSANGLKGFNRIFEGIGENTISYAVWEHAHFWNNELGAEGRYGHFLARYYIGYAALLNRSDYSCTEGYRPCEPQASNMVLYSGVGLGYVF